MCLLARRQAFIVIHHMQVRPCEADTVENLCNGFIDSSDKLLDEILLNAQVVWPHDSCRAVLRKQVLVPQFQLQLQSPHFGSFLTLTVGVDILWPGADNTRYIELIILVILKQLHAHVEADSRQVLRPAISP
jgi:hypothetical protein